MNALNISLNEDKLGCWSVVVGICGNIFGPEHGVEVYVGFGKGRFVFFGGSECISMWCDVDCFTKSLLNKPGHMEHSNLHMKIPAW